MKTNTAELKPAKFGETLTDNADGNPERSLLVQERVETRRRVCKKCGTIIPNSKRKDAIYCSVSCRNAAATFRYDVKNRRTKKPGVGSGGNQYYKNNHRYKNGSVAFRNLALRNLPNECIICKSIKYLCVHHVDLNRSNNDLNNLQILCKKHHQAIHTTRDPKTGRYIKG